MLTYNGGTKAKGGLYWNIQEWELVTMEGEGGVLPGEAQCKYLKVPLLLFLPLALVFGAGYVIFLPLIGFAMLFAVIGRKSAATLRAMGVRAGILRRQPVRARCE